MSFQSQPQHPEQNLGLLAVPTTHKDSRVRRITGKATMRWSSRAMPFPLFVRGAAGKTKERVS